MLHWLLLSPGHQQLWYWLYRINRTSFSIRMDFNWLFFSISRNDEKDKKNFFQKKKKRFSTKRVKLCVSGPPVLPPRNKDGDQQKIYDSVPRTDDVFNINQSDLELSERLGRWSWALWGRAVHDDVMIWKWVPHYWPCVKGTHWSRIDSPHTKAQ